jgi:hypothetical protein
MVGGARIEGAGPQGSDPMIDQRHLFSLLGAVIAALSLSLAPATAGAASHAHKAKPHKLTKRQKAAMRKQLKRALKRNPVAALRGDFLKRADASNLNLPLTLRLARSGKGPSDDDLGVTWTSERFAWPQGFAELQPAPDNTPPGGVIPLDGTSSLEAEFGNDTSGYVAPGVVETLTGGRVAFNSGVITPAIPVSDYAQAANNNLPLCNAPTIQLSNVNLSTGRSTQSLLHLFGGTARVTLHVVAGTTTEVVPKDGDPWSAATCGNPFSATTNTYVPGASSPIVPITFDATFKISPGVTADGKLRLGILSVPAGSTQPTTFARMTMCVDEVTPSCGTRAFPARLQVLQMSAEILVGDINA